MSISVPADTPQKPMSHQFAVLKLALPAVFLCLAVNLAVFAGIAVRRPTYLSNYRENATPDAKHYVLLGLNYLTRGEYSRCATPPYYPDMVRTPVYPLFAGALDLLGGAGTIYLAHALLQAGSCLLLFVLVRACFGERAAFWTSLLFASDLMLAIYNFEAMSEPLFLFLIVASMNCLLLFLLHLTRVSCARIGWAVGGGVLLGLAILTRPAALYLPVVISLAFLILGWRRKRLRAALVGILAFLFGVLPLPALWIARNSAVFSVPRLSYVDAVCSVYFAGGGAYQLRHGLALEEAHTLIAHEYGLPTHVEAMNPWISHRSAAEIDNALRSAALPVMTRYPTELLRSSLLGVVKASFSHNTDVLADLLGSEWVAPGMSNLLRLRPETWDRLAANGPLLSAVCTWQFLHVSLSLVLAITGIIAVLRGGQTRPAALLLLVVLGYFYLTVAMFGVEAYFRCRVPVLPFLYVFAGAGMARLSSLRRKATLTPNITSAASSSMEYQG